jgi:hypothetical protein
MKNAHNYEEARERLTAAGWTWVELNSGTQWKIGGGIADLWPSHMKWFAPVAGKTLGLDYGKAGTGIDSLMTVLEAARRKTPSRTVVESTAPAVVADPDSAADAVALYDLLRDVIASDEFKAALTNAIAAALAKRKKDLHA